MSTAPYVELAFNPTDLRPQDLPTVAGFLGSPAEALQAGLAVARARMIAQMKAEARGLVDPTYGQILQIADLAWAVFMPQFRKISAPVMADAYVRAYAHANAGDVPASLIYSLAEKHAEKTGDYFHASSRDALADGFNTLVNRRVATKAAADRVFDAYGLTPRQMRGYVNNQQLMTAVNSPTPFDVKGRAREYIDRSFTERIGKLSEQEQHNIDEQAKQYAWMWMQDKGQLTERAQKIWITAKDEKVCPVCGPLHGQKVLVSEQFKTKEGDFWSPGVHPNCRCVVRLIENRFRLEKRFDPHQPRGVDGRWSGGQSKGRQLGTKLNSLESPSARVLQGEVIHRSAQALGYVKEPRFLTTPIKEKDRDLARLARGASAWSRRGANVQRARKMVEADNNYYAGKMRMGRTEKSLKHLIAAVQSAPANSPELYRGMVVSPGHLDELKAGSQFTLPMSSFTESQPFSESFARKWGPMIAEAHAKREGRKLPKGMQPVVMVLEPKANALNISPIVSERQAEWITQGQFLITKVGDDNGLTVVHLKQTDHRATVSKADDWDAKLHPRGGNPENTGQFSRRPRPKPRLAVYDEPMEEPEEEQQEEQAAPEEKPEPEPMWGVPSAGWGSAETSQAWGVPQQSQQQGWGLPKPEPKVEEKTETLWGAPAEKPAQAEAVKPEPKPEPEKKPEPEPFAKYIPLHPTGRTFYRIVEGEGIETDFQLDGEEFTPYKNEITEDLQRRKQDMIAEKFRDVCGEDGNQSVIVKKYDPEFGQYAEAWIEPDTFLEMLTDFANQSQPYRKSSDMPVSTYSYPVTWSVGGHLLPQQENVSAYDTVRAQGIREGDFIWQVQTVTHGHNDPVATRTTGQKVRLSGQFIQSPNAIGSIPDDSGKETLVQQIEPW